MKENSFDFFGVVEIPQGSLLKYEYDKDNDRLVVDRVLNQPVPYNYGYIPGTFCDDGDPLDVFILGDSSIPPLTWAKLIVVGALRCVDNGKGDDKIIAILDGEDTWRYGNGADIIRTYLKSYKSGFVVEEQLDREGALLLYKKAKEMYSDSV